MENKSEIIARVQKLLEVTEEAGATPEEAASAAAIAMRIMQKYQVKVSRKKFVEANKIISRTFIINKLNTWKALDEYKITAVLSGAGIAEMAGVMFFTLTGSGNKLGIVYGTEEDIEFYFELLERIGLHCVSSMERDCFGDKSMEPRKLRRSYVIGYGDGFASRVLEIKREHEKDQIKFSDGTALVVVKTEMVETHLKDIGLKISKSASRKYNPDAAAKGYVAGSSAPINKSIKG